MTKSNKITRQIPALKDLDRPFNRSTPSKPAALYLLELRSRVAAQSPVPKRKLVVSVQVGKGRDGQSKPVKIVVS